MIEWLSPLFKYTGKPGGFTIRFYCCVAATLKGLSNLGLTV